MPRRLKERAANGLFKRLQGAGVPPDLAIPVVYANYPDDDTREIIVVKPLVPPRQAWGLTDTFLKGAVPFSTLFTALFGVTPEEYAAEFFGEDETGSDIFDQAAKALIKRAMQMPGAAEEDSNFVSACLWGAGRSAALIAAQGQPSEAGTEDYLAAAIAQADHEMAGRVVYALSWYFVSGFGWTRVRRASDPWLRELRKLMGPDDISSAEQTQLFELFEARRFMTGESPDKSHFPLLLCRWLNLHLGDDWEATPDVMSAMLVVKACQALTGAVRESLGG